MVDEPSSLGEAVMLWAGSIEHRELIYYTVSKSTTFGPPRAGPASLELDPVMRQVAAWALAVRGDAECAVARGRVSRDV